MVTVALDPVWQGSDGSDLDTGTVTDAPVLIGGGSVSDGSDASYVEMGAWVDNTSVQHYEPLSCDFVLPGTYTNPTAICYRMRFKNDIGADPPLSFPTSVVLNVHAVSDGTLLGDSRGGGSQVVFTEIRTNEIFTIQWRSFFYDDVDPDDPTDTGYWFEFAVDASDPAACVAALTGGGLRATLAIDAGAPLDTPERRRPWLDIYEFQLLVACEVGGGSWPLRRYPRSDGLGIGPTRHYPPPPSRRNAGGYR